MKKIDLENNIEDICPIISHLLEINDSRDSWRLDFSLAEVLFLVLCAQICKCENFEEYVAFGEGKLGFLRKFLPYKNGVPSRSTILPSFSNCWD